MPLFNTSLPMQIGGDGAEEALVIEHYSGQVIQAMDRAQVLKPFVNFHPLRGTNVISTRAVGKTKIATRTDALRGAVLPTTEDAKIGKNTLMVDTTLYTRHALDVWQEAVMDWNYMDELARADGIAWAKLYDEACILQAGHAAKKGASQHDGVDAASGFGGGNRVMFDAPGQTTDGNKAYEKLIELIVKFQNRDVDPTAGDFMVICRPEYLWSLSQADKIINLDYVTAQGQSMAGTPVLRTFGIPVVSTMNMPRTKVTDHPLSTVNNKNGFDVDFSDMPYLLVSQRALIAAEVLPLTVKYHDSPDTLAKVVTSFASFSVGVDDPRMAGALLAYSN